MERADAPTPVAPTARRPMPQRPNAPTPRRPDAPTPRRRDAPTPRGPDAPPRSRGLTVQGCISLAGAPAIIAHSLAQILELRPERPVELLAPGDLQLLAIARAMLRDPEVLVLIRPFAYVASRKRQRLAELLRAWQTGGAERIVECLLRQQGRHLNVLEERARPRPRTLVLAGVNIPGGRMPGDCSKDVRISLSEVGDSSPHAASAPACSLSFGDVMMQEEP